MFLRGIFSAKVQESLSVMALDDISYFFDNQYLPAIVKNNLFELTGAIEKGTSFRDDKGVLFYSYGIEKNSKLSKYHEKIRHKEFSIQAFEEGESRIPFGAVDENSITSEHFLVEQPRVSWLTLASKGTVEALEFKDDVLDNIEIYNNVTDYLDRTYGLNFKFLLRNSMNGMEDAKHYIKSVSEYEEDTEFLEALTFLGAYEEFYDFVFSDESEVLIYDNPF